MLLEIIDENTKVETIIFWLIVLVQLALLGWWFFLR